MTTSNMHTHRTSNMNTNLTMNTRLTTNVFPDPMPSTNTKTKNDFSPVKYNSDRNVLMNVLNVLMYKFKFKFLNRNTNKNRSKTVFVNDIDDINVINDINDVNDFVNNFVNKPPKPKPIL